MMACCIANTVHPHVRGDGGQSCRALPSASGSPPRAWGRRRLPTTRRSRSWFTPTCVGTASEMRRLRLASSVHPHVRGDGATQLRHRSRRGGSPPRAWGRREHAQRHEHRHRFTPTCVGTAAAEPNAPPILPVHPHVRGDGAALAQFYVDHDGSPPRAWGRRRRPHRPARRPRFTPTCVGTAGRVPARCGRRAVHPHVRGDGRQELHYFRTHDGSPPRAWGRPLHLTDTPAGHRFTPTCVGTARRAAVFSATSAVHPHVRGDGVQLARL